MLKCTLELRKLLFKQWHHWQQVYYKAEKTLAQFRLHVCVYMGLLLVLWSLLNASSLR